MNKKIILPISLIALFGFAIFVSASMIEKQSGNYEVSVTLVEGWNLVAGTIPSSGILEDSEIKISDLRAAWYYSLSQKKYILIENSSSIHPDDDEDSVLTSPMWVYSDRAGVLKYDTLEDYPALSDRQLMKGWNFLTITPEMSGNSLNDIKGTCNIVNAYAWAAETHEWGTLLNIVDSKELFTKEEDLQAGKGIIIKVSSDCNLGEGGSSTTPPPVLPQ